MGADVKIPSDIDRSVAESFWTLANLVCAFAVAQMIAYMMAAGGSNGSIATGVHTYWGPIICAIVVASGVYSVVLGYFASCHWKLLGVGADTARMLRITSKVRIAAMLSINAVGVLVTYDIGHL